MNSTTCQHEKYYTDCNGFLRCDNDQCGIVLQNPDGTVPGIHMDFTAGEPGSEQGEKPVLVEENILCSECNREHDIEVCPKCGSFISMGYGLAYGGMGHYKYCNNVEGCDWFWKKEDDH